MKRLRFFFRVDPIPPAAVSRDYPGAKRNRALNGFRPIAERYRRRVAAARILLVVAVLGIAVLGAVQAGGRLAMWGAAFFVTCGLASGVISAFGLRLVCPSCRKRLEPAKGPYCPVCGSDEYRSGGHLRGPSMARYAYCPSCDSTIDDGTGDEPRSYRIRGCTHCGVMLDEKGL